MQWEFTRCGHIVDETNPEGRIDRSGESPTAYCSQCDEVLYVRPITGETVDTLKRFATNATAPVVVGAKEILSLVYRRSNMPTTSVVAVGHEKQLLRFVPVLNKLCRLLIVTDALVAASTSASDMVARVYAALRTGTSEKYPPEITKLVERFEQRVLFMNKIGLINDTIVQAFLTARGTSAATDYEVHRGKRHYPEWV